MIQAALRAAERLTAALAEENAALVVFDLPRAAAMLATKQAVTAEFLAAHAAAEQITLDAPARSAAAPVLLRLMTVAKENRALLGRAIDLQARVIGTIARAVPRAALQGVTGYGAQGQLASGRARPTALAVCARA